MRILLLILTMLVPPFINARPVLKQVKPETSKVAAETPKIKKIKTLTGKASYYGYESGPITASGERFDPRMMTAAHKTLPFGTMVRVFYPRTSKSVLVRINDRGPFISGRVIDLSKYAAKKIGLDNVDKVILYVM